MYLRHLLPLIALTFLPVAASATWQPQGNPVSLDSLQAFDSAIIPDGSGGALIAWSNDRVAGSYIFHNLYALRIGADGEILPGWPAQGVQLQTEDGSQSPPPMVSDGSGGAFVVLGSYGSTTSYDVRLQHVTGAGAIAPGWPAEGIVVCDAPDFQVLPVMVSDGAGGVIIAWIDQRNRVENSSIFAQRIGPDGTPVWAEDGIPVAPHAGMQNNPAMVADGAGGTIIVWDDMRDALLTGSDIYAQRITGAGTTAPGWPPEGRALTRAADSQNYPELCSDGAGGAIAVWFDSRDYLTHNFDVYAQRVSADGNIAGGWPADGKAVTTAPGMQSLPAIASDRAGGAYVAWEDARSGVDADIYLQHLQSDGGIAPGFPVDGLTLCDQQNDQRRVALDVSALGEVLVVWQDRRVDPETADIYASRYTPIGVLAPGWNSDGNPICTATRRQILPHACADEANGSFIVWLDLRNGQSDVYATRVASDGLVAIAISLATVHAESDAVTLRWRVIVAAKQDVMVERRIPGGAWRAIGRPSAEGADFLMYVDRTVTAGDVYEYRLRFESPGGIVTGGETTVAVAEAVSELKLLSASARAGDLRVSFALRTGAPARLSVYDVSGRRWIEREIGGLDAGVHEVSVGRVTRPGIFLIRLMQGSAVATLKTAVVR